MSRIDICHANSLLQASPFMSCVAAFKCKFWRRVTTFTVPTGELTFQFSIKLLREETGAAVVPRAEAGVVSNQPETEEGAH